MQAFQPSLFSAPAPVPAAKPERETECIPPPRIYYVPRPESSYALEYEKGYNAIVFENAVDARKYISLWIEAHAAGRIQSPNSSGYPHESVMNMGKSNRFYGETTLAEISAKGGTIHAPKSVIDLSQETRMDAGDTTTERRAQWQYADYGAEISAARYQYGIEPRLWRNRRRSQSPRRIVSIVANGILACSATERDFESIAAAVTAAVTALEKAGMSTEVWHLTKARNNANATERIAIFTKVKAAGAVMNIDEIYTAFAHTSTRRYAIASETAAAEEFGAKPERKGYQRYNGCVPEAIEERNIRKAINAAGPIVNITREMTDTEEIIAAIRQSVTKILAEYEN